MAYTTVSKVRNLFGFSENDVGDAAIAEFIAYVDDEVDSITGTTWSEGDTYYAKVQEAAAILVGSLVYKRFRDKLQLSRELWDEGTQKLEAVSDIPFVAYEDPLE